LLTNPSIAGNCKKDAKNVEGYIRRVPHSNELQVVMKMTGKVWRKRGIVSIERPVLTLPILLFLQNGYRDTLSGMTSLGWNRRTVEGSLERLKELQLVNHETRSSFPKFEKRYFLTGAGEHIAVFVRHMEKELELCSECGIEDLLVFPKGCLSIAVHILRNDWIGVTKMIDDLSLSPTQVYRCLNILVDKKVLSKHEEHRGNQRFSRFCLTEKGNHLAIATEALDRALRRVA
jgi:predicted transcriptional regulator